MKRRVCKRCVLPENNPDIVLDEHGVCNVCNDFERTIDTDESLFETDFLRIVREKKGKGKFDCLLMCSGGKDSVSALYFIKKKFKLNPLVFTFDNGFENGEVLQNIHHVVKRLDAKFLFYRSDTVKEILKELLKSNSKAVICHLCSLWYMMQTFDIANKYGIKVIVAGWTKGQAHDSRYREKSEYAKMSEATKDFVKKVLRKNPKFKNFPYTMSQVEKRYNKNNAIMISPHWFMNKNEKEYSKLIKKELGWKKTKLSYPKNSTNCLLNYLSVYRSLKDYGYTHYHIEKSKLIRNGSMSRKEAMKELSVDFDEKFINNILDMEVFDVNKK